MAGRTVRIAESSVAETSAKKEKAGKPHVQSNNERCTAVPQPHRRNLKPDRRSRLQRYAVDQASIHGPSHIAMVGLRVAEDSLRHYECTAPTKLRLSVSKLLKLLREEK